MKRGPNFCFRAAHWIGGQVGNDGHGFGHDGGSTGAPCWPAGDIPDWLFDRLLVAADLPAPKGETP